MRKSTILTTAAVALLLLILLFEGRKTNEVEENIRVLSPAPNESIGLPLKIEGEARVFENTVNFRLLDENGTLLVESRGIAHAPDIGEFGPFTIESSYPEPSGTKGTLEVFDYSAKDGSVENLVRIPIEFEDVESQTVQVYFGSSVIDPDSFFCEKTYPLSRRIKKTESIARATIEELLRGPFANETGYFSSINEGSMIKSLSLKEGTLTVDFTGIFAAGVAGSCRVQAIRSQVENTALQFPTIKKVIILVEGNPNALEP